MKRILKGAALAATLAVTAAAAVAIAAAPLPPAPKWVAALWVEAPKSVGLRWLPVENATGYQVLRSETEGKGHEEIAEVSQPQYFEAYGEWTKKDGLVRLSPGANVYSGLSTSVSMW